MPPVTTKLKCSKLPPPANGAVTGSNSYGDVATFTCHPGYKLADGTSTITCQSDGTWSGGSPKCEAVQCSTLRPPANVYMRGSASYRGSMSFTCGNGYSLVGAKIITCQADGTWSGIVPTCKV
ncbi:E-selectin-like [Branchiostoma floridae x Branchiostoma japonicum]